MRGIRFALVLAAVLGCCSCKQMFGEPMTAAQKEEHERAVERSNLRASVFALAKQLCTPADPWQECWERMEAGGGAAPKRLWSRAFETCPAVDTWEDCFKRMRLEDEVALAN